MTPFDVAGQLPVAGTTLLEASAGTGKTWTIGALVTRYVAEGVVPLDAMLVVTFGRAASQELRERVREQLVAAERALTEPATAPASDVLLQLLLDTDEAGRRTRRDRLRAALTGFDGATIATIHQFCQQVLRGLGVAGDTDPRAQLVEDIDDLVVEAVDDLYLRDFAGTDAVPPFGRSEALGLGRQAVGDPQAGIEPIEVDPDSPAAHRVRFAAQVRAEVDLRKRRHGVLSYDDLLAQVADALEQPDGAARARMRQRWQLVLVDEFQDTDPVQWQVFDRAFTGHATMVLIGDPKQAVYGFRGGDVATYLAAKRTTTEQATLATNWRSDRGLLEAVQAVLGNAELGDPEIGVRDVTAFHDGARLVGGPVDAPFRLRVVRRDGMPQWHDLVKVGPLGQHIADDAAGDIARLLASGASFAGQPLAAGQVAVLSVKHRHGLLVREALARVGVPSVVAGSGSVFATPAAGEWLSVLAAMEQPHRSALVRAAALTAFVGRTATELAGVDGDAITEAVAETMRDWAELYAERGAAAVFETAVYVNGLEGRVLGTLNGERDLTDLRHIAEALHAEAVRSRLGLVALTAWLREQAAQDRVEVAAARTRRLDSDAAAVQILTVHASKGLEFPVVYLPFAIDRWVGKTPSPVRFHAAGDRRTLDLGGARSDESWRRNVAAAKREEAGESLRLLYVAMTRAQSRLVTWWAPGGNTSASPLHRILFGREPGTGAVPDTAPVPLDDPARAVLARWAAAGGPVVEDSEIAPAPAPAPRGRGPTLSVRTFDRVVDTAWRRTSYSGLTRDRQPAPTVRDGVGSEPEVSPRADEHLPPAPTDSTRVTVAGDRPSPMADLPVGTTFGSLVHAVLEHADPSAPDLAAEMRARIDEQVERWPVDLDRDTLARALVAVCDSPLGALVADTTLRRIGRADRMCELGFELPLAGGDDRSYGTPGARLADLAPLLRRHLEPGDPLLPFADAAESSILADQDLRGYLTGSLDVVVRAAGRYLVVDYKTNWLGPRDDALTAAAYRPEALAAAMSHSDYPLQALLYVVVLHRFLRWRVPGYQPAEQLGGVLYLYVRGMCGPETPVLDGGPCGVFGWRPPLRLVEELSDLLDGVLPARGKVPK